MLQPFNVQAFPIVAFLLIAGAGSLTADSIVLRGVIYQSAEDGTGPAVDNPSLNQITDGDSFSIHLNFTGAVTAPGNFELIDPSLTFLTQGNKGVEKNFGPVDVSVTESGGFDELSILGCLTTGSGCDEGNELDLNFEIQPKLLNGQNVPATAIFGLQSLDLLEDDGVTDIHGSVSRYSYTGASEVPEPPALLLLFSGVGATALGYLRFRRRLPGKISS